MANDWKAYSLGELFEFSSGLSKPASEFGSGYGFLSFKDVFYNYFVPEELTELVNSTEHERRTRSVRRGDVFLTRTSETQDELGMSSVALKDYEGATFNGFSKRLRPKSGVQIEPEYAGYFFRSQRFRAEISSFSSLSTRASLNNEILSRLTMVLPPLGTQKSIGSVLKKFDDKIELNRRMNRTLEAMAQAIFKCWFVDFEPVRAKAIAKDAGAGSAAIERAAMAAIAGRSTEEAIAREDFFEDLSPESREYLAQTAASFPDSFQESELGEIPEGWEVKPAESTAGVAIGKTPPRKEAQWFSTNPAHNRWVSIRDMGVSGVFLQETTEYLTDEAVSKFNVRRIPDRSVLLSFKLTIGRVAIADGDMFSNEAIAHFILSSHDRRLRTEYLYLYLKSFDYSALGSTSSIATAVNSKTIKGMPILLPSSSVSAMFEGIVMPLFQKVRLNQAEMIKARDLRDTILPKLLNGDIEVGPAEP